MSPNEFVVDTRKLRYTGIALAALKQSELKNNLQSHERCQHNASTEEKSDRPPGSPRVWLSNGSSSRLPQLASGRHIGTYALTTDISPWVKNATMSYQPTTEVLELVKPFASKFHDLLERERGMSSGLHDLDAIEMTYQHALEIGAAILIAADATDDPADLFIEYHASRAGGDDHLVPWGRLLTGLECDPPIIVQFPFYLMMCQSFTLEPTADREDYVYSALTGVDWAKGQNKFNDRLAAFEALARSSVPTLDTTSGSDRCFWRIALAYLDNMNSCENARPFKTPETAHIKHDIDHDLIIAARALDTIGSAFMCRDGAAWLDNEGIDSLTGSGLSNDVMDLHVDVLTGETRNLLRLLYPPCKDISQAMNITSIVLSSMLCEVFRGHFRARMSNREDGRVSSTSPAYSLSRARHRRIFETLELYISRYPKFWEWTWQIYHTAKSRLTDAAMAEPLVCGLKRAATGAQLPPSPANGFFYLWYDMVEDGSAQLAKKQPLGVSEDLAPIVRDIHSLWHTKLLDDTKQPGWGREFDHMSDMLLRDAAEILATRGGISEDMYKFAIAYGRMSMGLPYIAYHTVDAIVMTYGVAD
ncbi:hypothetical protein F4777DRAFT_574542 [Nemania sp. FL0916]|nr:hypothetical protein F4777DRAFT_574542 [Nemania sp. FL0916]